MAMSKSCLVAMSKVDFKKKQSPNVDFKKWQRCHIDFSLGGPFEWVVFVRETKIFTQV